jgi:DNA modification methylase
MQNKAFIMINPIYKNILIADLVPYKKNSRVHSSEQVKQLCKSISEFGFTNPLLVDENKQIIAGHCRLLAAKEIGLSELPCIVLAHLSDAQKKALVIADNKLALNASWDLSLLHEEIEALQFEGFDISLTGFGIDELADLFPKETILGLCEDDEVPDAPEEPITKLGDLWLLGGHRLMCGDSTSIDAVDRLMGGVKADMVFTDPPYGVNEKTNRASSGRGKLAKNKDYDKVIGDESNDTAVDAINLCLSMNIKTMVFWGGNYYCHSLPELPSWIIWDKRAGVASDDNADCELAWTNTRKPARVFSHLWKGCIRASEKNESKVHPTQKPVLLAEWCFKEIDPKAKTVLDLFGGSGSTLIACEKTGRKCFMMELDPKYCDVIIKRYELFSGKKAILEN